jgi:long-chain-fatty-acid--[acyl-carrier-protein] ligase
MLKELANNLILYPIVWLVRFLVFLRYRVVVKGLDALTSDAFKRSGGILFLPNHSAEIDPVILESVLWTKFRPRPLIIEHFYNLKGFKFFMKLVKALPLPTMDVAMNKWRGKKIEKQFNNIVSELKNKGSFLIYPSGRLKISGMELIGGASFVHKLLQDAPDTNVVLIRTSGLWGSKFSKALTGSSPDFGKVLWECVKILLKNGIFFAPRREVLVELALPPSDFPYSATRLEFNKYLENWYNRYPGVDPGPEPLKLVSFAFWKEEMPKVLVSASGHERIQERPVSPKIQQEVFTHLASLCGRKAEQIDRKMNLSQDLGLDSLDTVQVYVFLDEHFGVSDLLPGDLQTVEDVLQYAAGYKKERQDQGAKSPSRRFVWPEEKRSAPEIAEGETIQEVFLHRASLNGSFIAALDGLSGPLTYSKFKLGALILSDKIRKLPGDYIGVMLPATSGAYLIILGVMLAGKVPVMLNWTAGVKSLDHSVDLAGVQAVITSEKFLDKLEGGELGKMEQLLHFIEEIRPTITLRDKLRGLFLNFKSPQALLKKLNLSSIKPSNPAVILFTSGTESLPKGVPLSHNNILSNQRAGLKTVPMHAEEILYGVLPPFHSFGFSVTGLLPILAGMRVCYAPDPTDSHGLARDISQWKPTLFCCAPSFIKAAFRVAKPDQLQSLRLVVSGAEKTPQDLFDYVKEHMPNAHLLEGYGITECSPIVTIDRPDEPHTGVGKAILGVELMILDQETQQPVGKGKEGEVCIAGPNVFAGYLGNPRTPFITVAGKQWYLSGDRGYLDEKEYLILTGRLKRFVKIGGEMVSLGGLEEELNRLAKEKHWLKGEEEGPVLVVSAREKEADKPEIILFTTLKISKEDVNTALKDSGYGRIVKISEVRTLEQIPLTGTGKTHYRLLDDELKK